MEVKTAERATRGAGRRRRPAVAQGHLLRRRPSRGCTALSPCSSMALGSPPPWRWDPWGRQKRGFGGYNPWVLGVLHDLGFLQLLGFPSSHLGFQ